MGEKECVNSWAVAGVRRVTVARSVRLLAACPRPLLSPPTAPVAVSVRPTRHTHLTRGGRGGVWAGQLTADSRRLIAGSARSGPMSLRHTDRICSGFCCSSPLCAAAPLLCTTHSRTTRALAALATGTLDLRHCDRTHPPPEATDPTVSRRRRQADRTGGPTGGVLEAAARVSVKA